MSNDANVPFGRRALESLAELMGERGVDLQGDLHASLITGGRSNVTAKLYDEGDARWILRMPPLTGRTASAHDVAREFRVMTALMDTDVPVARTLVLQEDESLLGVPFTISEFVDGQAIQLRDEIDDLGAESVDTLVTHLVRTLSALHRVDPVAVGLEDFGRPSGYAERQLARWSRQWELVGPAGQDSLARAVARGLKENMPEQARTSVVHGDFRVDNTLVRVPPAGDIRVMAVVDWELSTLGDPVADVAMMCAYRHEAFDAIVGAPSAWTSDLLPSVEQLAELYEFVDNSSLANWEFHLGLAYYKVAVIAAGIDHRRQLGSGAGRGFDTAVGAVPQFLEAARDVVVGR